MAIPIPDQSGTPAGDFVNRLVLGEVVVDLINGVMDAMEDAGWTLQSLGASNWLSTTANPSNAQTCTIDGYVYTFKTAINNGNPREVLIDTTWQQTIQNLVHCINDDGVGEGTKYSSATTAHPNVTASYNVTSGYCYVSTNATGPAVAPVSVSEGMGSSSWAGSCYGGIRATTERSPDGHQMCVDLRYYNSTQAWVMMGDAFHLPGPGASAEYNQTYWWLFWTHPNGPWMNTSVGRYYRVIASKYSAWVSVPNLYNVNNTSWGASLVKLPDARMVAPTVSAATGGGGSLVTITQAGHGMVGSGTVYIAGAQGFEIDGYWPVTVIDEDSYTLDASTGVASGSYVADSARAANLALGQISQAYVGWCNKNYGTSWGPRGSLGILDHVNIQRCNQYGWSAAQQNGEWRLYYQASLIWFDARYWVQEAPVFMANDMASTNLEGIGWLWGALLISKGIGIDTQAVDSDGQKWHQFCGDPAVTTYGLMLAIPPAEN